MSLMIRVARLELLDEVEELELVLSHYAVSWASNSEKLRIDMT